MEFAKTPYYDITVDTDKNFVFMTVKGQLVSNPPLSDDASDVAKTTTDISNGFTIITDMKQMKAQPPATDEPHGIDTITKTHSVHSPQRKATPEELAYYIAVSRYI